MPRSENRIELSPVGQLYQGSALRQLRQERHFRLEDLAEITGYHRAALSKVENNNARPSQQMLDRLIQYLGIEDSDVKKILSAPLHPRLLKDRTVERLLRSASLHQSRPPTTSLQGYGEDKLDALVQNKVDKYFQELKQFLIDRDQYHVDPPPHIVDETMAEVAGVLDWPTRHVQVPRTVSSEKATQASLTLLERTIALIDKATKDGPPTEGDSEVKIVFHGLLTTVNLASQQLANQWWQMLRDVIHRGWNIKHLMPVQEDPDVIVPSLGHMLDLIGRRADGLGTYSPMYFPGHVRLISPDLILIPGKLGLEFAINEPRGAIIDMAELLPGKQLDVKRYSLAYLEAHANPVMQACTEGDIQWEKMVSTQEAKDGPRRMVQRYPSDLTFPKEWFKRGTAWAIPYETRGFNLEELCRLRLERFKSMERILNNGKYYYDIYSKAHVERYLPGKDEYRTTTNRITPAFSTEERISHIKSILKLLEDHPRYLIGLADESKEEFVSQSLDISPRGVLMAVPNRAKGTAEETRVIAEEPTFVGALRKRFDAVWENLKEDKDQTRVKKWFNQQLEQLENR